MPTPNKIKIVHELTENLKRAKSFVLTDYQGLSTFQLEKIKKEVEKVNAKLIVTKNTLLNLALKTLKIELPTEVFKGTTALLINFSEDLGSLKSLVSFAKGTNLPKIKIGYFENTLYSQVQVTELSTLPTKEVLLAKFLGLLVSPLQRLVSSLKSDQRKLAFILKARSEQIGS